MAAPRQRTALWHGLRRFLLVSVILQCVSLACQSVAGQEGLLSLACYSFDGATIVPGADITQAGVQVEFKPPFAQGDVSASVRVQAVANRFFILAVFTATQSGQPFSLVEQASAQSLTSGVLFELPYQLVAGSNVISLMTNDATSFELTITRGGWLIFWRSAAESVQPNFPAYLQIVSADPQYKIAGQYGMVFNLSVTGGRLNNYTAQFAPGSTDGVRLLFSALWTEPHSQTVLLTATRNLVDFPAQSPDVDGATLGDLPPFAIQITPNGHCNGDDGHLVLGEQNNGVPMRVTYTELGLSGRSFSVCYWHRPQLSSRTTQVFVALGNADPATGGDMLMGVCGDDAVSFSGATIDMCPFGALFMRNSANWPALEAASLSRAFDPATNQQQVDQWMHVCHSYRPAQGTFTDDGGMQMFVNGLPVTSPTSLFSNWDSTESGGVSVTVGSRSDGTLRANGLLDELYIFADALEPLHVLEGYMQNSFTLFSPFSHWRFFEQASLQAVDDVHGLTLVGTVDAASNSNVAWSRVDPICTAMGAMAGTLGAPSGDACIQPFRYATLTGKGTTTTNDGMVQIAITGSTATGGPTYKGDIDFPDPGVANNDFTVCVWVNRQRNAGPTTPQTIVSLGSAETAPTHAANGLFSMSYQSSSFLVSFGARSDDSSIPLGDPEGTGSSDDVGVWVHWCVVYTPTDGTTTSHRQVARNGRWWHTEFLGYTPEMNFQRGLTPATWQNVVCIGCKPFDAPNDYPAQGLLDELHVWADAFDLVDIHTWYLVDYWSAGSSQYLSSGALLYFNMANSSALNLVSTIDVGGNPITKQASVFTGIATNAFTTGGSKDVVGPSFTCVTLGPQWMDAQTSFGTDTTDATRFKHGTMHPFAQTNTDYAAVTSTRHLQLNSLAPSSFSNSDWSFCYWRKISFETIPDATQVVYDLSMTTADAGSSANYFFSGSYTRSSSAGGTLYYLFSFEGQTLTASQDTVGGGNQDNKRWVHICGTYQTKLSVGGVSGANGLRKLYRQGQLIGEDFPASDMTAGASSNQLFIGRRGTQDATTSQATALYYDEVMLWSRAITTEEIRYYLQNAALPTAGTQPILWWQWTSGSMSSVPNGETLTCQGGACLTPSVTPGNQVQLPLNIPQVCPVGMYADGGLRLAPYVVLADKTTTDPPPVRSDAGHPMFLDPVAGLALQDYTFAFWVYRLDDRFEATVVEIGCAAMSMQVGVGQWHFFVVTYLAYATTGDGSQKVTLRMDGGLMTKDDLTTIANGNNYDLLQCGAGGIQLALGARLSDGLDGLVGVFDDFRLWSRLLSEPEQASLLSGKSVWPRQDTPGSIAGGLAAGLELAFDFAEQVGSVAYSTHDLLASTRGAVRSMQAHIVASEPLWYGTGVSTFLDFGFMFAAMQAPAPLVDGSVRCLPSSTAGHAFFPRSTTIAQYRGLPGTTLAATVELIWTQPLGVAGLTVKVHTPAQSGIVVSPDTITYPRGVGGRMISQVTPKSFTLTATAARYVTLTFSVHGPEGVHMSNRSLPTFSFAAYQDITTTPKLTCRMLTDTLSTSGELRPVFESDLRTAALEVPSSEVNRCYFSFQRYNNDAIMPPVVIQAPASRFVLMRQDSATQDTVLGSTADEFDVPIGTHSIVIKSFDADWTLALTRAQSARSQVQVSLPMNVTHGQLTTIALDVPPILSGGYINVSSPLTDSAAPVITPTHFTISASTNWQLFYVNVTLPITQPAQLALPLMFTVGGYAGEEVYFDPATASLPNTYATTYTNGYIAPVIELVPVSAVQNLSVATNPTCTAAYASRCRYGATCSVTLLTASTFKQSCQCPAEFGGPFCQFAILGCSGCVIPATPLNRSAVLYANLNFTGIGFGRIVALQIGILRIPPSDFVRIATVNATDLRVQAALASFPHALDASLKAQRTDFSLLDIRIDVNKLTSSELVALQTATADSVVIQSHSTSRWTSLGSGATKAKRATNLQRGVSSVGHSSFVLATTQSGIDVGSNATQTIASARYIPINFEMLYAEPTTITYGTTLRQSYYSTCLLPGEYKPDPNDPAACLPCPQGGVCPGGGYVFPVAGYWGENSLTDPISCKAGGKSCPGSLVNTTTCATGYRGRACSECEANYYQTSDLCFPCSTTQSEQAQLAGLLLFGLIVVGALSAAVAFASSEQLALIVSLFVVLQQAVATAKASSRNWTGDMKRLGDFFNALGVVNWDIEFLRPGCIAPKFNFTATFWGTLLFVALAYACFVLACLVRRQTLLGRMRLKYLLDERRHRELVRQASVNIMASAGTDIGTEEGRTEALERLEDDTKQREHVQQRKQAKDERKIQIDFRRRTIHATLILFSLFYLKLSTIALKDVRCIRTLSAVVFGQSEHRIYVLFDDRTVECLDGAHISTTVATVLILVCFTAGFPLLCFYLLTRAFAPYLLRQKQSVDTTLSKVLGKIGYQRAPTLAKIASLHRAGTLDQRAMRKELAKRLAEVKHADPNDPTSPGVAEEELNKVQALVAAEAAERQQFLVHMALFGYLFRGCKDERYFFRLFTFPISLGFTLTLIFADSTAHLSTQTFILGLLYATNGLLHALLVPFRGWMDNVIGCGSQLASVIYAIGIISLDKTSDSNPFYMATLAVIAVIVAVPFAYFILMRRGSDARAIQQAAGTGDKASQQSEGEVFSPLHAASPIAGEIELATKPTLHQRKSTAGTMMATLDEQEVASEDAMNQIEEEYNHELLSVAMAPDALASPSDVRLHLPKIDEGDLRDLPELPEEEPSAVSVVHVRYAAHPSAEDDEPPAVPADAPADDELKHDDEAGPPLVDRSISVRHWRDTEAAHPYDDNDEKDDAEDAAHVSRAELYAAMQRQRMLARQQEKAVDPAHAPKAPRSRKVKLEMMQSDSIAPTPR